MKVAILDEVWHLFGNDRGPSAAYFFENALRRVRMYYGSIGVVVQTANDLTQNPVGNAVLNNVATKFLLHQGGASIATLREADRLSLGNYGYELLQTVRTVPGVYSEAFIVSNRGCGIARLVVSEYEKLLYSDRPTDVAAVKAKRSQGLSANDAILAVLEDRLSRQSENTVLARPDFAALLAGKK